MRIAVVTFDGFNEIDSFVALNILNRVPGWRAEICAAADTVTSGNGVRVHAQTPLELAGDADAVLFGSGRRTAEVVGDRRTMSRFALDPRRQLVGAQCSGALALARLGLLGTLPACTDLRTRPLLEAEGIQVLRQSFFARGHVGSAGGCLAAPLLATWVIRRLAGRAAAAAALAHVAPVGEHEAFIAAALSAVEPFLDAGEG